MKSTTVGCACSVLPHVSWACTRATIMNQPVRYVRACLWAFRLRLCEDTMKLVASILLAALASASAFQLAAPRAAVVPLTTSHRRTRSVHLQEKEELSAEQIVAAAEKASEPSAPSAAWPEGKPVPQYVPVAEDVESGKFDPRIILYVSLPALVLIGQVS